MTTATATRKPRQPRLTVAQKAEALLANSHLWLRARAIGNTARCIGYLIPSNTVGGKYHLTNGKQCDCKAARAGRHCCHVVAAAAYIAQKRAEAAQAAAAAAAMLTDDAAHFTRWSATVDARTPEAADASDVVLAGVA